MVLGDTAAAGNTCQMPRKRETPTGPIGRTSLKSISASSLLRAAAKTSGPSFRSPSSRQKPDSASNSFTAVQKNCVSKNPTQTDRNCGDKSAEVRAKSWAKILGEHFWAFSCFFCCAELQKDPPYFYLKNSSQLSLHILWLRCQNFISASFWGLGPPMVPKIGVETPV